MVLVETPTKQYTSHLVITEICIYLSEQWLESDTFWMTQSFDQILERHAHIDQLVKVELFIYIL